MSYRRQVLTTQANPGSPSLWSDDGLRAILQSSSGSGQLLLRNNGASNNFGALIAQGGNGLILYFIGSAGELDTTLERGAGAILTSVRSFAISQAGQGLRVKEGANAKQGTSVLAAGTVVVANTSVTANSRIQLSIQALGTVTVPKAIGVTARVAGTSFTITSADVTDTSTIAWEIFEPA